jgi:predicted ATPase
MLRGEREAARVPAAPIDQRLLANLPAPLTSFIGRRKELVALRSTLLPDAAASPRILEGDRAVPCRLVTLTGPGGCGKTRLALQAADDLLEEYPDGVWAVELAALPGDAEAALVAGAVAAALGPREAGDRPLLDTLVEHLRPRRLLLVLDNCEHLLEGCAAVVSAVLQGCAGAQIVATSRETLGVGGEQVWPVPPLSLPEAGTGAAIVRLLDYEAVRLFLERGRAQQPALTLTEANGAAVAEICRRLDGLPLAIELAATRVGTLGVEGIAARLRESFRLLTGGPRTGRRGSGPSGRPWIGAAGCCA